MPSWVILPRWFINWTYSYTYSMPTGYIQSRFECGPLIELYSMHSRLLLPSGWAGRCHLILLRRLLLSKRHSRWSSVSLSPWNIWGQSRSDRCRGMSDVPTREVMWLGYWSNQQQHLASLSSRALLSSRCVFKFVHCGRSGWGGGEGTGTNQMSKWLETGIFWCRL